MSYQGVTALYNQLISNKDVRDQHHPPPQWFLPLEFILMPENVGLQIKPCEEKEN